MTPGPGFVDIHSHVLYGIDDGAATIEESVAMLAIAEQAGTTDIVATPHANSEYAFVPAPIAARMAELQPRTSMRIHPGCDFHLHASNFEDALAHPEKYTLNHGNYLLVKFPEMSRFRAAGDIFRQLLAAGPTHQAARERQVAGLRADKARRGDTGARAVEREVLAFEM